MNTFLAMLFPSMMAIHAVRDVDQVRLMEARLERVYASNRRRAAEIIDMAKMDSDIGNVF